MNKDVLSENYFIFSLESVISQQRKDKQLEVWPQCEESAQREEF
jgi:hypothetical protein